MAADTYYVQFVLPTGYSFTGQDVGGDDAVDSDADSIAGQTALFTLIGGSTNNDMDAGLVNSQLDYGDLPDSYSNTILGDDGARHVIGTLRLGTGIGADVDGQEDPTAARDSYDDGVTRNTSQRWTNGTTVDVNIDLQGSTGSGQADVGVWIDWGGDGVFDPATDFFTCSSLTVGIVNACQITVPGAGIYTVGSTLNVRVRAFDPASLPGGNLDAGDQVGLSTNGEVEDYQWEFSPTAVTLVGFSARAPASVLAAFLMLIVGVGIGASALLWRARRRKA